MKDFRWLGVGLVVVAGLFLLVSYAQTNPSSKRRDRRLAKDFWSIGSFFA